MLNNQELTAVLRQNGYKVTRKDWQFMKRWLIPSSTPVLKCCSALCSPNIRL